MVSWLPYQGIARTESTKVGFNFGGVDLHCEAQKRNQFYFCVSFLILDIK